jgi:endonuclease/exonuclease/phosphatase family metal-dependent hydrolase
LSTLEALRPDVAGLQEVWATRETTRAHQLAEQLGMHATFAAPSLPPPPSPAERPDQAGVEVGVAVLSRWPILTVHQHRLPSRHRPQIVALAAVLDHPGGPLHVVVSCLNWKPEPAAQPLCPGPAGTPPHPVVVSQAFLAGDPREGRYPSDHDAVVADVRV